MSKKTNKYSVIVAIFMVVVVLFMIRYLYTAFTTTSTDNAQIQSHIYPVISQVSGKIVQLNIKDNEHVSKGDTLLVIEQIQYLNNLDRAMADVESAKIQIKITRSNLEKSAKNKTAVTARLEEVKATNEAIFKEYKRKRNLYNNKAISKAAFDKIFAKNKAAKAKGKAQEALVQIAEISYEESDLNASLAKANLLKAKALLGNVKFKLDNTFVIAPESGNTPEVKISEGQFISSGQILTELVGDKLWVVANYKETQIRNLTKDTEAIVKIDAFPNKEFKVKMSSMTNATGAKFALLPTDNATGNFVKIVQRIPVKFEFMDESIYKVPAVSGMSVTVIVEDK